MFGFILINEMVTKLFILFVVNIIITFILRKVVEQHKEQLFYLLMLHLLGWGIAMKIVYPGMPMKYLLLFLVTTTISAYFHELGHVITWAFMRVRLVKAEIIPMLAFGVLPDLDALSKLKPRKIMLAAMMGPAFNLALALGYEWFGRERLGAFGNMFTWVNYMNFLSNILPIPFTDGAYCMIRIFRSNSKALLVTRNMLLYTGLTMVLFMPPKVTLLCLGLLAAGSCVCYVMYWLFYGRKYRVVEIETGVMELLLSLHMGVAFSFGYIFMGPTLNKIANAYGPTVLYMIRAKLGFW